MVVQSSTDHFDLRLCMGQVFLGPEAQASRSETEMKGREASSSTSFFMHSSVIPCASGRQGRTVIKRTVPEQCTVKI